MYVSKSTTCDAVIQMLFVRLTNSPCRKNLLVARRAIAYAQMTKITNHARGSTFDGINATVAIPIATPNRDNVRIKRQFMMIFSALGL